VYGDSENGLPCLTRSSVLWHVASKRWMLPVELAASLGLPVRECLAQAAHLRHVDAGSALYSPELLGNSVHVPTIGLVLATTLVCAGPRSQTSAVKQPVKGATDRKAER